MEKSTAESRLAKKRVNILKIALKVFAKEGFRNTDVQVIADLAKVGKGTVYRHFGNKEQLFLATARDCLDRMGVFVQESLGPLEEMPVLMAEVGTIEMMRRIAIGLAQFYEQEPQAVEIMIQERAEFRDSVFPSHLMFRAESRVEFEAMLGAAMDAGELRRVDVVDATNAFADLIYGSAVNGCLEGAKRSLVDRVTKAVDIFLHGLVPHTTSADAVVTASQSTGSGSNE